MPLHSRVLLEQDLDFRVGRRRVLRKSPDNIKPAPDSDSGRVPPGQFVTEKFPVLTYGPTPPVDIATWHLRLFGEVQQEAVLDWQAFLQLPWSKVDGDFHCVTQWSALDNTWEGVAFSEVAKLVDLQPTARHVMAHCYGGYTTNVPLDLLMQPGCMLAHKHNGEELSLDHGWPVRLLVPMRYGWKSAKWLNGLELMAANKPGFWEERGYHNEGDPWKQERFWPELTG